jgi:hypothetical protein
MPPQAHSVRTALPIRARRIEAGIDEKAQLAPLSLNDVLQVTVLPLAGFAYINALTKISGSLILISRNNARTLLVCVLRLLRTGGQAACE